MMKSPVSIKANYSRGDTIVEVLIAIAAIGVALGFGYALAGRSLQTGEVASERTAALSLAQSQVEFIKNAQNSGDSKKLDLYKVGNQLSFCIAPAGNVWNQAAYCARYNGSAYNVGVVYSANPSNTGVFTITVKWDSRNAGVPNQLQLYYKLPGSYASSSPPPGPTGSACGSLTISSSGNYISTNPGVLTIVKTSSTTIIQTSSFNCVCTSSNSVYSGNGPSGPIGPIIGSGCPVVPGRVTCGLNGNSLVVNGSIITTYPYTCVSTLSIKNSDLSTNWFSALAVNFSNVLEAVLP